MDEGEIALADHAEVPEASKVEGGGCGFCEGHDPAGLAVQSMHHLWVAGGAEVEPDAADEAGGVVALGRMADETGGLVDHEEVFVLVQDVDPAGLSGHLGSHFFQLAP